MGSAARGRRGRGCGVRIRDLGGPDDLMKYQEGEEAPVGISADVEPVGHVEVGDDVDGDQDDVEDEEEGQQTEATTCCRTTRCRRFRSRT